MSGRGVDLRISEALAYAIDTIAYAVDRAAHVAAYSCDACLDLFADPVVCHCYDGVWCCGYGCRW